MRALVAHILPTRAEDHRGVAHAALRRHERNLLDVALQDAEAVVVVQVDAVPEQQLAHLLALGALLAPLALGRALCDGVAQLGNVLAVLAYLALDAPREGELAPLHHITLTVAVDDQLKVDRDARKGHVGVLGGVMDEAKRILLAHVLGVEAEAEERRVDHVRLAAAIGADDARHALVERADLDDAEVRL